MSIFGRSLQEKRLIELDQRYRNARDGLMKERARGHVINWLNNFRRLDRLSKKGISGYEDEVFPLLLGQTVKECVDFRFSDSYEEPPLKYLLIELEKKLTDRIFNLAGGASSLENAVISITRSGELEHIIRYLSDLSDQLLFNS